MSLVIDPAATRSAVLALVPTAEPVVGALRNELDPTATLGVPAHVTVLYPFVPAPELTDATVGTLRRAVRGVGRFSCRFDALGWFDDDYLWLAPDRPEPFVELIERTARAFPDHPPYEGAYDETVPHLTVGYRRHSSLGALRRAAARIEPQLPVTAEFDRVHLLAGGPATAWHVVAEASLD